MVRGWGIPEGKEAGLRSLAYKGGVWLSPGRLVFTLEPALLLTGRGQLPWGWCSPTGSPLPQGPTVTVTYTVALQTLAC